MIDSKPRLLSAITNNKYIFYTIFISLTCIFTIPANAKPIRSVPIASILKKLGYDEIPIIVKNGFLSIHVTVSKHAAMAIIDTGSTDIGATQNTPKALNLPTKAIKHSGIDMYGRQSSTEYAVLPRVIIGNTQLEHVKTSIFRHVHPYKAPTLIIGNKFLKQHHAIIDIYNKILYLSSMKLPQSETAKIEALLSKQYLLPVPLMSLSSGSIVIPLQINRLPPVNFLFDTGTGVTLVSQQYMKVIHSKQKQVRKAKQITLESLIMNPLNLSFQPTIRLHKVPIEAANFAVLRKYLYVQGILGLPEMIKAHAIIFSGKGIVFLKSG